VCDADHQGGRETQVWIAPMIPAFVTVFKQIREMQR
jgi:hypothetical protein